MSSNTFIPFSPPLIGEEEINEVIDTLRSNWITTGPKTRQFEADFSAYMGAPGALAVNSCTAALHTALVTAGVGPGDEVISTPMTFCSTINVIEHSGARPVLVDVQPDTLNIDPKQIAEAITPKTRAIIPVHYAGHPVDLDPIEELATTHGLQIIEDAAHALPAKYKDRYIGAGKNPVAYSFYATKNMTTAEGGMLTGDAEFLKQARMISLHGMSHDAWKRYDKGGSWFYEVVLPGFKYNMTDIQASLGIWQLKKLQSFHLRRQEVVRQYHAAFSAIEALETPTTRPYVDHAWHLYGLRLHPEQLTISRDQFIDELTARGIGTSVHFIPIHLHPYYHDKYNYTPEDFPVAFTNYQRILSLPLNPRLTDDEVTRIVGAVTDIVGRFRK
ncbi:MAG TPA: DegT/DnrJ/EryC1/StrS aminotransferase family protein [Armatimonadota bacterium]|jgi:dTDP-4-amino-4,6-dideoxygalactose transaminase